MSLGIDERGFVLSGIALLLILPAMLLAATYLESVNIGGGAVSTQTISDKVYYAGKSTENEIRWMWRKGVTLDDSTLQEFADDCEASTGLVVKINRPEGSNLVKIEVYDPGGTARYSAIENLAKLS